MAQLRLEIVTAERVVYSEDVDVIVTPGVDGQLSILPNHAPLLTMLKPGELRVVADNQDKSMAVSGGFLEVLGNKATILADTAEEAVEIDIVRAETALQRAQERIDAASSDFDLERAMASLRRSQARLVVARRRGRSRQTMRGTDQASG